MSENSILKSDEPIFVTQPYLPPLDEFLPYLEAIWKSRRLTNGGPFHQQLENVLSEYLGIPHLSLFVNGTLALVTALQTLRITGEVITTPYTFVATSHALLWNNIRPVFADIDAKTCNLDPEQIERCITPQTTAILAVHCYGTPCDVDRIEAIANTYGLKVIYDAAHAFGIQHDGSSLLAHGDLSVLSFHATKVFNTFEGGAIACPDARTKRRIDFLKNFGFADETTVMAPGINGKMNEFQAALGLLQLKHVGEAIRQRQEVDAYYRSTLSDLPGIRCLELNMLGNANFGYFPIFVSAGAYPVSRDTLYEQLKAQGIHARRYFYPLITHFPMYRASSPDLSNRLPTAERLSREVLCLPIYPGMPRERQDDVINIITANLR